MISLIPHHNNNVKYDRKNYDSFLRYKNYLLNNKIDIGNLNIGDNVVDDHNYAFKIKIWIKRMCVLYYQHLRLIITKYINSKRESIIKCHSISMV